MSGAIKGKKGEKKLLLGNEAIARGALEAGIGMFTCYPGTPSSEVADTLREECASCDSGAPFRMEYSINEKVALEVAAGAALGGVPAMAAMKHVGLNVAADPLMTCAYVGMPGGLVILSADDPGCHSSQNEQDNRAYARFAGLPCLEPATPAEARDMTAAAFDLARRLEQPVLLRATTRVCHSRGPVELGEARKSAQVEFARDPGRYVPVPAVALRRHHVLDAQLRKAAALADQSSFNFSREPAGASRGVIASGVARGYLADALALAGWENDAAVLELGMTWPLPEKILLDFMSKYGEILVLEEGSPLLENDLRALAQKHAMQTEIAGKDEGLVEFGEYSARLVRERLARWLGRDAATPAPATPVAGLPRRPPNLCPGCAHRSVYYAARKVFGDDAIYSSDIGCYTLGMLPPLKAADFLVCMGSSVSAGSGFSRASGKTVLGFIGDSTFFHSGISGLANAIFNKHDMILTILDNGVTAMTGHQPNPGMLQEQLGEDAAHLEIENIIRGLGITSYARVPANNVAAVIKAYNDLKNLSGVRVLIAEEPCLLYARRALKRKKTHVAAVKRQGPEAEECARDLACPAFVRVNGDLAVDAGLCGGCMVCLKIAPRAFIAKKI